MVLTGRSKDNLKNCKMLIVRHNQSKAVVPSISKPNISYTNVVQITDDLNKILQKPAPKFSIFKWFRNKGLELDNERLILISNYISQIQEINSKVLDVQYQLTIQPQILQDLIAGYYIEAERKMELQYREHQAALQNIEYQMIKRKMEIRALQAKLDQMEVETEEKKAKVALMRKIVEAVDIKTLPEYLQIALTTMIFNPNQTLDNEIYIMDELKKFIKRQKEAETTQMEAEAQKKLSESKVATIKALDVERDYKRIWAEYMDE